MSTTLKYIIFCIFATLVNLYTQRLFLNEAVPTSYFLALLTGTIAGLMAKYVLDKNFIFNDRDNSFENNSRKFSYYSINGIFTTFIFWGTESLFFYIYMTSFARELGAIIGLTIGYYIKYKLDKKYVFKK